MSRGIMAGQNNGYGHGGLLVRNLRKLLGYEMPLDAGAHLVIYLSVGKGP